MSDNLHMLSIFFLILEYLWERARERERDTTPTTSASMNEGHFILIIAASSYVNLGWVYWAWLWDKCYCPVLEVVPIVANNMGIVGPVEGIISFVWQCCAPQGWVLWGHVVSVHCKSCWVWFMGVALGSLAISLPQLFVWVWATCCRVHSWDFVVCICLGGE